MITGLRAQRFRFTFFLPSVQAFTRTMTINVHAIAQTGFGTGTNELYDRRVV